MKELTKAEEQVMQELWKLGKTTVKCIIDELPEPKPAYNTISTIVRILETKGFVDHQKVGKGYVYFSIVSIETYKRSYMKRLKASYFKDSFKELVSFFAKEDNMDVEEFEKLMNEVKDDLNNEK